MLEFWPLPATDQLIDNCKEWLLHVLSECSDQVRDMVILLIWRVWNLRSEIAHGKVAPPLEISVDFLVCYLKSLDLARRHSTEEIIKGKMTLLEVRTPEPMGTGQHVPWPPPPVGQAALSVDGSFSVHDGSAATGMVLRCHDGSFIFVVYRVLFRCNDALEEEIHALVQGMALALQHTELKVIVQSDSIDALSILSNEDLSRSTYGHLVAKIKALVEEGEFIPQKICRDQNRIADCLANYSRTECCTTIWSQ